MSYLYVAMRGATSSELWMRHRRRDGNASECDQRPIGADASNALSGQLPATETVAISSLGRWKWGTVGSVPRCDSGAGRADERRPGGVTGKIRRKGDSSILTSEDAPESGVPAAPERLVQWHVSLQFRAPRLRQL